MRDLRSLRAILLAAVAFAVVPRVARASCGAGQFQCGAHCYDSNFFQCCLDGTDVWLCGSAAKCGSNPGECGGCQGNTAACLGCTSTDFPCPKGTVCNGADQGIAGYCVTSCPSGKFVCGFDEVCFTDSKGMDACCGGQLCGNTCIAKTDVCCLVGNGTGPYGCASTHRCGMAGEDPCVLSGSNQDAASLGCSTAPSRGARSAGFFMFGAALLAVLRTARRRSR